jgi:uncharacterized damage-inducible protein DinB
MESARLSEFSLAVRESTLKRLRLVPSGQEVWRPTPEAMSIADLACHLIEADRWLFLKLQSPKLDPVKGEAGVAKVADREPYLALLEELRSIGKHRAALLADLTEDDLNRRIYDARYHAEVTVWWVVVRGNLDHEAHHRGQIAAYLRVMGIQS